MPYTFPKSAELFARAQNSIAAGINSGIRKMEVPVPLYFDHGKGSRLFDVDGNEYIDFQIGQGAILYGHAPVGMADAIAEQAPVGFVHGFVRSAEMFRQSAEGLPSFRRAGNGARPPP